MSDLTIIKPKGLSVRVKVSGQLTEAEVVHSNKKSLIVRLKDGRIISRKRGRDY